MSDPFRVFIGYDERQADAAEVLRYSIEQNASIPVDVMRASYPQRQGVTAFTHARFLVPHWCGYEGTALFLDSDMLCLGDVAELAALDMSAHSVRVVRHGWVLGMRPHRRPRVWTAAMLMHCEALAAWTEPYVRVAPDWRLMRLGDLSDDEIGDLPPEWHVLAGYETLPDGVKLCHWSHLADMAAGDLIDRSGSALWHEWRDRWRSSIL